MAPGLAQSRPDLRRVASPSAAERQAKRYVGVWACGPTAGLEGRCLQRPGSSKDFDVDDDQMKILAKNQDSELGYGPKHEALHSADNK